MVCEFPGGAWRGPCDYYGPPFTRVHDDRGFSGLNFRIGPVDEASARHFHVQPTAVDPLLQAHFRLALYNADLYAVIPFTGERTALGPDGDVLWWKARWAIGCGCGGPEVGESLHGGIFETDLADVRPEYAHGLLRALLALKEMEEDCMTARAAIMVIVARTPGSEDFFLQALMPARIEALRSWLMQNGYPDASSIRIDGDLGAEDVVVVRLD